MDLILTTIVCFYMLTAVAVGLQVCRTWVGCIAWLLISCTFLVEVAIPFFL